MNNRNKNYRVMKFFETVTKGDSGKGYVRLDMRGNRGTIMVTIENVGDNKSSSEVYLFKDNKDKIKIGTLNNRKGIIKRSINAVNENGPIEDYNICGVVKDNRIILFAPLFREVGVNDVKKLEYMQNVDKLSAESQEITEAIETIEKIEKIEKIETIEKIEIKEVTKATENTANKKENAESVLSQTNTDVVDECAKDDIDYMSEEIEKMTVEEIADIEADECEKYAEEEDEDEEEDAEAIEIVSSNRESDVESLRQKRSSPNIGDKNNGKRQYKNAVEENLYEALKDYTQINPLSCDIKNLSWWKISYDGKSVSKGFLPYFNQIISAYYPYPMATRITTCSGLMKKYGYYLFGVYREKGDIKKYIYGVPGKFLRDEQPYKGATGFKNWSYKNKEIPGDYGFWLAFIDSETGALAEPPQIDLDK